MRVLSQAEVRDKLANGGLEPMPRTPQEYGTFLHAEIAKYAKVITEANIKAD